MLKHSINALTVGVTLALGASGAWAATGSTLSPPDKKIGVTPQDAKEATQKAVPRTDTGTVVRTAPSAAERASDMTKDTKEAVTPDSHTKSKRKPPVKQP